MKKLIKNTLVILIITATSLSAQVNSKRGGHYNSHHHSNYHYNYNDGFYYTHHRPNHHANHLLRLIVGNIVYNLADANREKNTTHCPYKDYIWVEGYWRKGLLRWHWVEGYWQKRRVAVQHCGCGNHHY